VRAGSPASRQRPWAPGVVGMDSGEPWPVFPGPVCPPRSDPRNASLPHPWAGLPWKSGEAHPVVGGARRSHVEKVAQGGDGIFRAVQTGEGQTATPMADLAGRFLAGPQGVDHGVPFPRRTLGKFSGVRRRVKKSRAKESSRGASHSISTPRGKGAATATATSSECAMETQSDPCPSTWGAPEASLPMGTPAAVVFTQEHAKGPPCGHASRDELGPAAWLAQTVVERLLLANKLCEVVLPEERQCIRNLTCRYRRIPNDVRQIHQGPFNTCNGREHLLFDPPENDVLGQAAQILAFP
jgi:hypothetical protein